MDISGMRCRRSSERRVSANVTRARSRSSCGSHVSSCRFNSVGSGARLPGVHRSGPRRAAPRCTPLDPVRGCDGGAADRARCNMLPPQAPPPLTGQREGIDQGPHHNIGLGFHQRFVVPAAEFYGGQHLPPHQVQEEEIVVGYPEDAFGLRDVLQRTPVHFQTAVRWDGGQAGGERERTPVARAQAEGAHLLNHALKRLGGAPGGLWSPGSPCGRLPTRRPVQDVFDVLVHELPGHCHALFSGV